MPLVDSNKYHINIPLVICNNIPTFQKHPRKNYWDFMVSIVGIGSRLSIFLKLFQSPYHQDPSHSNWVSIQSSISFLHECHIINGHLDRRTKIKLRRQIVEFKIVFFINKLNYIISAVNFMKSYPNENGSRDRMIDKGLKKMKVITYTNMVHISFR